MIDLNRTYLKTDEIKIILKNPKPIVIYFNSEYIAYALNIFCEKKPRVLNAANKSIKLNYSKKNQEF